jgi:hypothetical protein
MRVISEADAQRFTLFGQHLNPNDAPPLVLSIITRLFRLVRSDMQHSRWLNAKKAGKLTHGYQHTPTFLAPSSGAAAVRNANGSRMIS